MRKGLFHHKFLVAVAFMSAARVDAQTVGITIPSNAHDLGVVTAAVSGTTVFRIDTNGNVTRLSGTGTRQSSTPVTNTVTVACSGGGSECNKNTIMVRVSPTSLRTGRAGGLTNLTVEMETARLVSGPTTVGSAVQFTIDAVGKNNTGKAFRLGFEVPISGGFGASGPTTAGYLVEAGFTSGYGATGPGTAKATTRNPTQIIKNSDLRFGSLLQAGGTAGTIALDPNSGVVSSSNNIGLRVQPDVTNPSGRAEYSVTGEGGQLINVTVPTTFTMSGPSGNIAVNLTKDFVGSSVTLGNTAGTSATRTIGIGGNFAVSGALAGGTYTGTFNVDFSWN